MKTTKELRRLFATRKNIEVLDFDDVDNDCYGGAITVNLNASIKMRIIFSCDEGWDHISVSLNSRTPKYQEMKAVKKLFFKDDEWAIEYHPPEKDYVNIHSNVLHIWRPHKEAIPVPPKYMV